MTTGRVVNIMIYNSVPLSTPYHYGSAIVRQASIAPVTFQVKNFVRMQPYPLHMRVFLENRVLQYMIFLNRISIITSFLVL